MPILRRLRWSWPAGALRMPTASPGSTSRRRRRWPKHASRCSNSRPAASGAAGRITAHGRILAKLGMHPRLAHMRIKAQGLGAERLACGLAAILSERDILRANAGARDADLRLRVAVLRGDQRDLPAGVTVDARARAQAQRTSSNWQRDLPRDSRDSADPHHATGILLAWAYPDRIAQSRGDGGRYLLANGRGARFAEA